jgi:hypothetical protein
LSFAAPAVRWRASPRQSAITIVAYRSPTEDAAYATPALPLMVPFRLPVFAISSSLRLLF